MQVVRYIVGGRITGQPTPLSRWTGSTERPSHEGHAVQSLMVLHHRPELVDVAFSSCEIS